LAIARSSINSAAATPLKAQFTHALRQLVFAILVGVAIRSVWTPAEFWRAGVEFSAKTLL